MTDYYEINADAYFAKTVSADPSVFLSPFVLFLPAQPQILDIGCGSGRDLLWLKQRGYHPTGLERSASLARLAREKSGCPVIEGDLETFDFSTGEWNAVLMVGSLVHISHNQLLPVLQKMLSGFVSPYTILLTMKAGDGCFHCPDGRTFFLWKETEIEAIIRQLNLRTAAFFRNHSAIGNGETWLGYVLQNKNLNF